MILLTRACLTTLTGAALVLVLLASPSAMADEAGSSPSPSPSATATPSSIATTPPNPEPSTSPTPTQMAPSPAATKPTKETARVASEETAIADLEFCPAGIAPKPPRTAISVTAAADQVDLATPPPMGAWSNLQDMDHFGYYDPWNREPWTFATNFARIICGAADGADIKIGMYFIRALEIDPDRPESDANAIYDALEWVKANRKANISIVLEGMDSCILANAGQACSKPMAHPDVREKVAERFASIGEVIYCINACFNTGRFGTNFYGISHEKFVAISDTVWPNAEPGTGPDSSKHPMVISSSGNWARSQIHSYVQDAMFVYDDYKIWDEFDKRADAMRSCALDRCAINTRASADSAYYPLLKMTKDDDRGVWASSIVRRPTDAGKGTEVIFSPQHSTFANAYVSQLDAVDCKVDSKIRIAMFSMTDGIADRMARRVRDLSRQGCDVDILLSLPGGGRGLSDGVIDTLNDARIEYRCTARSMHTKLILIGPANGATGSILEGTQNMSVSGQLYSDEHIISIKPHKAYKADYRLAVASVYGEYTKMFAALKRMKDEQGATASKGLCS